MSKQLSLHSVVVVEFRRNRMFEFLHYACDCEHQSAKKGICSIIHGACLVQEKLPDRKGII